MLSLCCDLHKCFLALFPPPLGDTWMLEGLELDNCPFPKLDEAPVKCFFLESRLFYGEYSWFFHRIYISPPFATNTREFFLDIYLENLTAVLGVKTPESVGASLSLGSQQFLTNEHLPPVIYKITIEVVLIYDSSAFSCKVTWSPLWLSIMLIL